MILIESCEVFSRPKRRPQYSFQGRFRHNLPPEPSKHHLVPEHRRRIALQPLIDPVISQASPAARIDLRSYIPIIRIHASAVRRHPVRQPVYPAACRQHDRDRPVRDHRVDFLYDMRRNALLKHVSEYQGSRMAGQLNSPEAGKRILPPPADPAKPLIRQQNTSFIHNLNLMAAGDVLRMAF